MEKECNECCEAVLRRSVVIVSGLCRGLEYGCYVAVVWRSWVRAES